MEPAPLVIQAPILAADTDSGTSMSALTRGGRPVDGGGQTHGNDPDRQHLHDLIAHYISSHYPAALPAFLSASGASDPATLPTPNPDLRTLVADAASAVRAAELARQLEATELGERGHSMTLEAMLALELPPRDALVAVRRTLQIAATNLLAVAVADLPFRRFDTGRAEYVAGLQRSVVVSAADREVRILDYESGEVSNTFTYKAPVLCLASHPTEPRYLVTGSMDGVTSVTDVITGDVLQRFNAGKFIVRLAFSHDGRWLAAASYDHTVTVYEAVRSEGGPPEAEEEDLIDPHDDPRLAASPDLRYELRHTAKTDQNPEALLFHPRAEWLMYTVRGSHELHYLRLPGDVPNIGVMAAAAAEWTTVKKSFNPHPLDSHVSFAVLDMALHPSGRVIACITGDHAGTAGERVLIYGVEPDETERLTCLWTGSESDAFVLPRVAWLPCGRGVVTSSATGHIKLVATATGEVRSQLQVHKAQGPGTSDVVRDLAVVPIGDGDTDGWEVVSVGYDRCVRFTRGLP